MKAVDVNDLGVEGFETSITEDALTPSTWPCNTKIHLCNVPWDSDYKDVIEFASASARDTYFTGLNDAGVTLENAVYLRPGEGIKVDIPYSACYTYNYVWVENTQFPEAYVAGEVAPPKLYYFIQGVAMLAPNCTELTLQLDIWTTYRLQTNVIRGFVERGHVALHAYTMTTGNYTAATKTYTTQQAKRRYLLTPEGLDVGGSYVQNYENCWSAAGNEPYVYVIVATVDLSGSWGTVSKPKLQSSKGSLSCGVASGCNVYGISADEFFEFMVYLSGYPWISSNIISITAVAEGDVLHNTTGYPSKSVTLKMLNDDGETYGTSKTFTLIGLDSQHRDLYTASQTTGSLDSILKTGTSARWQYHPKGRVYPYSYMVLANYTNQPCTYKPELFADDSVAWVYYNCAFPAFAMRYVFPRAYGYDTDTNHTFIPSSGYRYRMDGQTLGSQGSTGVDNGLTNSIAVPYGFKLDNALVTCDYPQLPIVNDSYFSYLAGNVNSLAYARNNAGWNLDKSQAYAQTSYDNANRSLQAGFENQQTNMEYLRTLYEDTTSSKVLDQIANVANSAATTFSQTPVASQLQSVASAYTANSLSRTGELAAVAGNTQFTNTYNASQGNVDANYKLANWAAKGDYNNAIAGINATVRDAQLLSPTVSGSFGGATMGALMANGVYLYYLQGWTVTDEVQAQLTSYWDWYGYAVHEYMDVGNQLSLMQRYTYWKMQDVTLSASGADEGVKMGIRGILEKGVRVWASPDYIMYGNSANVNGNLPVTTIANRY